jgi:Mn2+/Fe2+ NRAMP family transporter
MTSPAARPTTSSDPSAREGERAGGGGEGGVTLGAAFLMATSAIGPGFLTQTALFTALYGADFAFAVMASVLVDVAVQANVWRVLGVARMRGQELASALLPGLGTVVAVLVALGGLAFNVGNVAGCGLGLNVFGLPTAWGATLSGLAAVVLLWRPRAGRALDVFAKTLASLKILLTAAVMVWTHPDYAAAARAMVMPSRVAFLPIVTLVGGTVGGYITFAGVHRLLDAGIGGPGDARRLGRAAVTGIVVTAFMRMLLFLAVLGVVGRGGVLDRTNPAASAFRLGAGEWGYNLFGVVLWAAAISSVVGCSYTSLSFFRGVEALRRRSGLAVAAFIGVSLAIYLLIGRPVGLLVAAGALNGLILPVTLGVVLLAARRRDLLGAYRHPRPLLAAGWVAWAVSLVAGARAVAEALGGVAK